MAEVKYVQHPEKFKKLVEAGDRNGIWNMITDSEVEMKVLERVELKARTYGKDPASKEESELFIDPKKVREIYEQIVIPFTKEVQILYLYERVDC